MIIIIVVVVVVVVSRSSNADAFAFRGLRALRQMSEHLFLVIASVLMYHSEHAAVQNEDEDKSALQDMLRIRVYTRTVYS